MPPKLGVAGKRVAKELKEMDKELPEGIRWGHALSFQSWFIQLTTSGPID